MKLEVTARMFPEGSQIVAHAKELDIASCGRTETEAIHALMEAIRLFLTTCLEVGTFEQVLEESGYIRQGDEWIVPSEGWSPDNIIPLADINQRVACVEF